MSRKFKPSLPAPLTVESLVALGAPKAFESIRDEIMAVPADALAPLNLDVSRAARRGLMVAERVKPLLAELSIMSHLDYAKVEKLPMYALALLYAHEQAEGPDESAVPLAELLAEAVPLRADLLQTAEGLAHFGLVSRERVAHIRSGQGHVDTAADLLALGMLLGDAWPRIEDKVVIEREAVDRAIPLSAQLHQALGMRESDDDPLAERKDARHLRAQAFTLFVGAYDECRRGVSHLRWHQGDAALIVPSLYPRRGRVKAEAEEVEVDEEVVGEVLDLGGVGEPEAEVVPEIGAGALAAG